jgi:hypothetical protein
MPDRETMPDHEFFCSEFVRKALFEQHVWRRVGVRREVMKLIHRTFLLASWLVTRSVDGELPHAGDPTILTDPVLLGR